MSSTTMPPDVRSRLLVVGPGNSVSPRHPYQLLSTRQVMAIFRRTDRTIRNWVATGHLRPIKVGRSVFFHPSEIDALLGLDDANSR